MLKLIGGILVAGSGVGLAVNMIAEIRQHLLRLYEIRQLLINISGEAALALLPRLNTTLFVFLIDDQFCHCFLSFFIYFHRKIPVFRLHPILPS